jgi:hypothetical protein
MDRKKEQKNGNEKGKKIKTVAAESQHAVIEKGLQPCGDDEPNGRRLRSTPLK